MDGLLDVSASPRTHYSDGYDKVIVKEGDIVFRGRAGTAAALVREAEMPLIVASPLVILFNTFTLCRGDECEQK